MERRIGEKKVWEEEFLEPDDATGFRGVAVCANFLKSGLSRSAVSSEADEQGDGKANGGQLEEDEEDCQIFDK